MKSKKNYPAQINSLKDYQVFYSFNNFTNAIYINKKPSVPGRSDLLPLIIVHKEWSFQLRISSVNLAKSAVSCGFHHICWRNPQWKTSFFWPLWRQLRKIRPIRTSIKKAETLQTKLHAPNFSGFLIFFCVYFFKLSS